MRTYDTLSTIVASIKLSGEFHLTLFELAGNEVVSDVVRGLIARSSLIMARYHRLASAAAPPMSIASSSKFSPDRRRAWSST